MKRKDLLKELCKIAKDTGVEYREEEGAKHTKVSVGDKQTTVARHTEINELTAQGTIKFIRGEK